MTGTGFDAGFPRESAMSEPSQNTQWVACAAVNMALRHLATNLAAYLGGVPRIDGRADEAGREAAIRLLAGTVDDPSLAENWTDLEPGDYDADEARRIALEMLGDILDEIRTSAVL